MKAALLLSSLMFIVHISGCLKAVEENNAGTSGMKPAERASPDSEVNLQNTPDRSIERSSPNPRNTVLFDGRNYIKKSGWEKPSRRDTYIDGNYDRGSVERLTKSGKRVRTSGVCYGYRTPSLYSEDFYYEGRDLDYLKGTLEPFSFIEERANGKIFFYSVFAQKSVSSPLSNNDPHEDPFSYQIMDTDGDGVFETLLGDYDEIVVPDWVLR